MISLLCSLALLKLAQTLSLGDGGAAGLSELLAHHGARGIRERS